MAAADAVIVFPDVLRSIASSSISSSYQAVGTPLTFSTRIVKFTNNSNEDVLVSWNGVDDHDIIPAGGFLLLDVSANLELNGSFEISALTQFYAKGTAGTGTFYISSYYGKG